MSLRVLHIFAFQTYKARQISTNDKAQVVVKYIDGEFLHDIAAHYGWCDFDALAVVCDYAFQGRNDECSSAGAFDFHGLEQKNGSRLVDLTSAIEFVGLTQENVIAVLEYLLGTRSQDLRPITKDFVVVCLRLQRQVKVLSFRSSTS